MKIQSIALAKFGQLRLFLLDLLLEDLQLPFQVIGFLIQLLFLGGDEVCKTSYADRKGKYQKQTGVVLPRILAEGETKR